MRQIYREEWADIGGVKHSYILCGSWGGLRLDPPEGHHNENQRKESMKLYL